MFPKLTKNPFETFSRLEIASNRTRVSGNIVPINSSHARTLPGRIAEDRHILYQHFKIFEVGYKIDLKWRIKFSMSLLGN